MSRYPGLDRVPVGMVKSRGLFQVLFVSGQFANLVQPGDFIEIPLADFMEICPHRLGDQDVALSRLRPGFESPWGHSPSKRSSDRIQMAFLIHFSHKTIYLSHKAHRSHSVVQILSTFLGVLGVRIFVGGKLHLQLINETETPFFRELESGPESLQQSTDSKVLNHYSTD